MIFQGLSENGSTRQNQSIFLVIRDPRSKKKKNSSF